MLKWSLVGVLVGGAVLVGCTPSVGRSADPFPVTLTRYFTPVVFADPSGVPLRGVDGQVISAPIALTMWCLATQEGSVMVVDAAGRQAYNSVKSVGPAQADCSEFYGGPSPVANRMTFEKSAGPWGQSSSGRPLIPFRSVAVDRKRIALGSVLFLPELAGRVVPNGTGGSFVHDGYVLAVDEGHGVKGAHVDLFVGFLGDGELPGWLVNLARTPVQVVTDSAIRARLEALHR